MSEYDEYKKNRQQLVDATKIKMSTPDGGAGMDKVAYEPLKPTTFKEKWINYWYHYKLLTFGSLFGAILIIVFAWQMIFRTVYDAKMVVFSSIPLDSVVESFEQKLGDMVVDYTKNGKLELSIMPLQSPSEDNESLSPEMMQANFVKLSASLSTLETYIYMVDQSGYDYLIEAGVSFMDLTELADQTNLDQKDRYSLKDTNLGEKLEMPDLLDTMYLCFIDYSSLDEKRQNKKDIKANYERDIVFFENLIAYK